MNNIERKIQTLKQKIKRAQKRDDRKTQSESQKELNEIMVRNRFGNYEPSDHLLAVLLDNKIRVHDEFVPDNDDYYSKDY